MKILFLLGDYYPSPSANGVCIEEVASSLEKKGHDVFCICNKNYGETENYIMHDNINIYKIKGRNLLSIIKVKSKNGNFFSKLFFIFLNKIRLLGRFFEILFWPKEFSFKTNRIYKLTKKLHKELKFDIIIAVHKPINTLIAAYKIKKRFTDIKYIAYFLDSLSGGFSERLLNKKFDMKRKIRFEKKYLLNCNKIICMKASVDHNIKYHEKFKNKLFFLDIPLLTIKPINECTISTNKIRIVFAGLLIYPRRNIVFFIELFKKLGRNDVELILIGQTNIQNIIQLASNETFGLIKYYDFMQHSKLDLILNNANILLNLGVTNSCAISGKIFEYMSYRKPIISTYSIDDEACLPYLKKYPAAYLIDERDKDLEKQANLLNSFINNIYDKVVDINEIYNEFYANTPQAFIDEIENS